MYTEHNDRSAIVRHLYVHKTHKSQCQSDNSGPGTPDTAATIQRILLSTTLGSSSHRGNPINTRLIWNGLRCKIRIHALLESPPYYTDLCRHVQTYLYTVVYTHGPICLLVQRAHGRACLLTQQEDKRYFAKL